MSNTQDPLLQALTAATAGRTTRDHVTNLVREALESTPDDSAAPALNDPALENQLRAALTKNTTKENR